jgi:hypothetical protein
VLPQVAILKDFYEYSQEIEQTLPKILHALCSGDPIKNLESKQATTKQFAELLHFVLLFDDLKMTTPAIQNDFSYYRRTLSRMKMSENVIIHSFFFSFFSSLCAHSSSSPLFLS